MSLNRKLKDVRNCVIPHVSEPTTLGLSFNVWNMRMSRFWTESTSQAFHDVRTSAGGGGWNEEVIFSRGFTSKMVKSATKGVVLSVSKEVMKKSAQSVVMSSFEATLCGQTGRGLAQVPMVGPCIYFVTTSATDGDGKNTSEWTIAREMYIKAGLRGFYLGQSANAFKQATKWANRQRLIELARTRMYSLKFGDDSHRVTVMDEVLCGIVGGTLSSRYTPFEVTQIQMQAHARTGKPPIGLAGALKMIDCGTEQSASFKD